ncbi:hypothetical protein HYR99_18340 [Candidatus Poribacteria bacterium]|nr:hypothetical protein [Candidatus Poribacteria bacterium]
MRRCFCTWVLQTPGYIGCCWGGCITPRITWAGDCSLKLAPSQTNGVQMYTNELNELNQHYVATGRMTLGAWTALEELRSLRQKADYELATPVRLRHVNRAISLFTAFAEECYQSLGVS